MRDTSRRDGTHNVRPDRRPSLLNKSPTGGCLEPGRAHAYWKTAAESIWSIVSQLRSTAGTNGLRRS